MIINWTAAAASSPPPLQSHLTLTLTAAASLGLIWLPVRLPSFPHLISVWCVLFTLSHLRLLHLHRLCPPPPLPSRLPNLVLSHSLNSLVLVDARLFARYLFCTPPPPPLRSAAAAVLYVLSYACLLLCIGTVSRVFSRLLLLFCSVLFCLSSFWPPCVQNDAGMSSSAPFTHITARRGRRHWSSLGTTHSRSLPLTD